MHTTNPNLENHSTETILPQQYFLPYFDHFISQLTERFINHKIIFKDIHIT